MKGYDKNKYRIDSSKKFDAKYSSREILSIYYSRLHYKRSITMCKNYMSCLRALY